jgi:hypothetical protein
VKVFGAQAPLPLTFEVVLVAGVVCVAAGIIMGMRAKADALVEALAKAEEARARFLTELARSGPSTLAQISVALRSIATALDEWRARGARPTEPPPVGTPAAGTTGQMTSGEEAATAQALGLEVAASETLKMVTDTVKGTVGQIPKLDRGAQFVALGVILILVAAGVGMFVYAIRPVG